MNYIRGAVSAISAPYHYYKDLPPINPSTLTGAIDVIVIQRPTDNGDTELVCSPFHVRFGKWQVLRPSEKTVNVSVNGHPIPFNMKIGEAGEAFFVFETSGDVPNDLITSPILQPTRPDELTVGADSLSMKDTELEPKLHPGDQDTTRTEFISKRFLKNQEPDFLDLDAQTSKPVQAHGESVSNLTPKQAFAQLTNEQLENGREAPGLPSPPLTPTFRPSNFTPERIEQEQRIDAVLKSFRDRIEVPQVDFNGNVALDVEGYHYSHHDREKVDPTTTSLESEGFTYPPRDKLRSATPSPVHRLNVNNLGLPNPLPSSITFPMLRAASEPPPDIEEHHDVISLSQNRASSSKIASLSPVQEYSWEWGAFPQPSPVNASFSQGGRMDGALGRSWTKGKGKADNLQKPGITGSGDEDDEDDADAAHEHDHGRSKSVPPELEGSPQRRLKELVEACDASHDPEDDVDETSFGKRGILRPSKRDPSRFVLQIEGRRITFELSIVPASGGQSDGALSDPEEDTGFGWRSRHGRVNSFMIFDGRDEVEAARQFALGKIDYKTFLDDDEIVKNSRLVIRWAGNQYITRGDGSPLMNALVVWRYATLQHQNDLDLPSRPTSPVSDEEINDGRPITPPLLSDDQQSEVKRHHRSKSEPPEEAQGKPASSWVRWWRSSKKTVSPTQEQPEVLLSVKNESSGIHELSSVSTENVATAAARNVKRPFKELSPAESAPAYPSTPMQAPTRIPAPTPSTVPPPASRKFAKTLRLSSDQLKSLNLKPGANTITFSLSASGAVACTARIFVWDSTDLVVVSDIDGTITKSDGLGHVFAMIGRDWTHLGVAKLYTDITRNGYKIMYLTSRAIGQADATRAYLGGIKQNNYQLPEGPVIMSPDRLITSLHREVILRKPEVFKMACLRDIQRLFGEASRNPFYGGFGNRITDALSYRSVNVPSARIFTIDSTGEVKMELLELAGYKSSYIHMTDLVDQMFPPIHRKWTPEFTDFNYWKTPVQDFPLPDLSPPSPALSARSDNSTLARLRNFSLVPGRQGSTTPASRASSPQNEDHGRSSHLRQMSSFERLSSTLGWSQTNNDERRSTSPASSYDSDDEGRSEGGHKRERRRSIASMPGTLDEIHFGIDDDDDDDDQFYGGGDEIADGDAEHMIHETEETGEDDFDEDLFVAREMENVPFL